MECMEAYLCMTLLMIKGYKEDPVNPVLTHVRTFDLLPCKCSMTVIFYLQS